MNRLDQLAQPNRRNGEHIRAILERERQQRMEIMLSDETELTTNISNGQRQTVGKKSRNGSNNMSRSLTHLAGSGGADITGRRQKYSLGGGISTNFPTLGTGDREACKSMSHLGYIRSSTTSRQNIYLQTAVTINKSTNCLQSPLLTSSAFNTSRRGQHSSSTSTITKTTTITTTTTTTTSTTNKYNYKYNHHYHHNHHLNFNCFDTDSLLLMNCPSLLLNPGVQFINAILSIILFFHRHHRHLFFFICTLFILILLLFYCYTFITSVTKQSLKIISIVHFVFIFVFQ